MQPSRLATLCDMTWWTKLAIALSCFSAVVFFLAGIVERNLDELGFGALAAFVTWTTWQSAARQRKPRA